MENAFTKLMLDLKNNVSCKTGVLCLERVKNSDAEMNVHLIVVFNIGNLRWLVHVI